MYARASIFSGKIRSTALLSTFEVKTYALNTILVTYYYTYSLEKIPRQALSRQENYFCKESLS